MSLTALSLSLQHALRVPPTKVHIGGSSFVLYVLPPLVCAFVVAWLAVTPRTPRLSRIALWPLVALLALRAALSVDMSLGKPGHEFNNTNFILFMFSLSVRSLDWSLAKAPLVRHLRPVNSTPSSIMDAFDLVSSFRGLGWNWSSRLYVPRETRPTNRTAFAFHTCLSLIAHGLMCGVFYRAVAVMLPTHTPDTPTLFDPALPILLRYLRSSLLSLFCALMLYAVLQMNYDLCTLPGILLLHQDPAQWPPIFYAPWRATSLADFWSRRWHQFFRRTFVFLGGYPLALVLGRSGIVVGTFLASVVWHQLSLITLGRKPWAEMWRMLLGFGVMAPGILAEEVFWRYTGKRVDGVVGWCWTMSWLLLWGNVIVEGFVRGGMFGCSEAIDVGEALWAPVERLVGRFDDWLHTI